MAGVTVEHLRKTCGSVVAVDDISFEDSINALFATLPGEFVDRLYEELPPDLAERALRGMRASRPITFRVNSLRVTDPTEIDVELAAAGVETAPVPWYRWGRLVSTAGVHEGYLARLPAYREGRLYLQSLSSMLPPLVLQPQPGERVLDLAAAPGSKTTQIAAMMENRGTILACEINPLRAGRLRHNLQVQGVSIATVVEADGAQVAREPEHVGAFDRVLVDAPCSGEGLFSYGQADTYRHWSPRLVHRLAQTQRKLLAAGWQALRSGGRLVYSTCTLSLAENEEVIAWALRKFGGQAQVEPAVLPGGQELTTAIADALPGLGLQEAPGRTPPFVSAQLSRTVRILPSNLMEGFFLAVLHKQG